MVCRGWCAVKAKQTKDRSVSVININEGYSTLVRSPELKPQNQMQFSDNSFCGPGKGLTLCMGYSQHILAPLEKAQIPWATEWTCYCIYSSINSINLAHRFSNFFSPLKITKLKKKFISFLLDWELFYNLPYNNQEFLHHRCYYLLWHHKNPKLSLPLYCTYASPLSLLRILIWVCSFMHPCPRFSLQCL